MISSLVWVPAGVADPHPKRYEMSATELELIAMMDKQGQISTPSDVGNAAPNNTMALSAAQGMTGSTKTRTSVNLPKIDEDSLPADLRMNEYSDDEDDNENEKGVAISQVIMGGSVPVLGPSVQEAESDDDENDSGADEMAMENDDNDSSDDDSDDELADIPDTREFTPVDAEGLQSMGISLGGLGVDDDNDDDDESEAEDVVITADDAIVLVAKTEEDFATLEVHVYDQVKGNLYVHHDLPLPAFPLCLAHGQVAGNNTGNFCAVGTFNTGIEIWNLDVLNALEPTTVLGGEDTTYADDYLKYQMINGAVGESAAAAMPPPKLGGGSALRSHSHTDAVMSLSWNNIHKQVLASGSADSTVKLWDTMKSEHATTFTHHRDKVQAVEWNPSEGTLLATGSYDRTISLVDARNSAQKPKSVKIKSDCEALAWNPFHVEQLTAASEDGTMTCWDVRKFVSNQPLWSFVVNEFGGTNDFAYNPSVPDMLVTCSIDKTVTLWDMATAGGGNNSPPQQCGRKDMCSGKLYTVGFYQSAPWLLGCGGSGNQLSLWDLSSEDAIEKRFSERMANAPTLKSKITDGDDAVSAPISNPADAVPESTTTPADTPEIATPFPISSTSDDDSASNTKIRQPTSGSSSKKKKKKGKKKAHKR